MSDPQNNNPSGFFEVINKARSRSTRPPRARACSAWSASSRCCVVAAVFFVTENYFVAMVIMSFALLVYVTGAELAKLLLTSFTIFFSSKHVIAHAAYLQDTLVALRNMLLIRRDVEGNLRAGPIKKGTVVKLPDNPLVRDIQTLLEHNPDYEYAEYIAHAYYVQCHEVYDHASAHLEFVATAMPLFGLIATIIGLIGMFESLGAEVTVEYLSPQLALALKTHAVRRAARVGLQDHRVAVRSAAQGARLRLRHVLPRAPGADRQPGGDRGAAVKVVVRRMGRAKSDVWQIIYMDLMTQIMMFFVILWSISQVSSHARGVTRRVGDQTVHMVTLPGDVLFPSGKAKLTPGGEQVFAKLFQDNTGEVLNFDTGGLTRRVLVVHGHTDGDGAKDDNFVLGFQRALSVYREIKKYGPEIADHAVLCSHADNSPARAVPRSTAR